MLETEAFVAARDQTAAQVAIARSNLKQAEIRLEELSALPVELVGIRALEPALRGARINAH
ncbi:hypothetical protein D3C83_236650 [compost metagenome]